MSGAEVMALAVLAFVAGLYVPWLWAHRPRRRRRPVEYVRVLDALPPRFDGGKRRAG